MDRVDEFINNTYKDDPQVISYKSRNLVHARSTNTEFKKRLMNAAYTLKKSQKDKHRNSDISTENQKIRQQIKANRLKNYLNMTSEVAETANKTSTTMSEIPASMF